MQITHITDHFRVGEYPTCFDIEPIDGHSENGLCAIFHFYSAIKRGLKRVEFRRKDRAYALFIFPWDNVDLPAYWRDSELLWSLSKSAINTIGQILEDAGVTDEIAGEPYG